MPRNTVKGKENCLLLLKPFGFDFEMNFENLLKIEKKAFS